MSLIKKEQCPACAKNGGDTSKDNLAVYDDGGKYCFACGYTEYGNFKAQSEDSLITLDKSILQNVLQRRNISEETIEKYNLSLVINPATHRTCVKFPVSGVDKKFTEFAAYREVSEGHLIKNEFTDRGVRLVAPFGWHLYKPNKHKKVLLVEGKTDTLIADSANTDPSVCVLGMWGASYATSTANFLITRDVFDVTVCFDNDNAGIEAFEKFNKVYGQSEKHIDRIITQANDIGEELKTRSFEEVWGSRSKALSNDLETGENLISKFLNDLHELRSVKPIHFDFCPGLGDAVPFMRNDMIGLIGAGGAGKSTLVNCIILELLYKNHPVLYLSKEMGRRNTIIKLLDVALGRRIDMYDSQAITPEVHKALKRISSQLVLSSCSEKATLQTIEKEIKEAKTLGAHHVVIDHTLAVADSFDALSLTQFYSDLKKIAMRNEVCVVIITHSNRSDRDKKDPKLGANFPTLSSVYGSSGLEYNADCVLGIGSNKEARLTKIQTLKLHRLTDRYYEAMLEFSNNRLLKLEDEQPREIGKKAQLSQEAAGSETEVLF